MENLTVIKRITNRAVSLNEAQREEFASDGSGFEKAASPQLTLNLEIVSNACEGVLLQYRTTDGSLNRSLYQRSVVEAELAAEEEFGIQHNEWNAVTASVRKPDSARPTMPRR